MSLVRLSDVFGETEQEDSQQGDSQPEEIQIVVYADQGQTYGLVVHRIVDIVETILRFQQTKGEENNLLGTTVIGERVTDVLNLRRVTRLEKMVPEFIAS